MSTAPVTRTWPTLSGDGGPILQLEGVSKTYAAGALEVHALRGIDLQVPQGDYLAVMGPSGSGKSTLMHILGCLDTPSAGTYRLGGVDVSDMDEQDLAEVRNRRIGFVFQQFNLLPSMAAWRNVELPLVYAGVGRGERRRRATEALGRVGLGDRVDHRPNELSGGQQQPTGNLDSRSTLDVLDLFRDLHDHGRTIVLITHEHDVGEQAARRVLIRDGRLFDSEGELDGGRS